MILAFLIGVPVVLAAIWLLLWAADPWRTDTCPETHNGVRCTDRAGHRSHSCTFPAANR